MDYTSLGCCALAFVLYLNTLNTGFVYDDRRAILTNKDVSGSLPWLNAFQNDYWGTPLTDSGSHGSYRPLCVLSFRLNFLLGGYTPWGYHLINNLMHCLATGLVVKLARHFLSCVWGVLATGALFAAHPIHTEAVAGLVGRADLAACIFYLLTFLTYLQHIAWRERGDLRQWFALLTTIFFSLLALLFKETAVTALLVCCIFDCIRGLCTITDKHRKRSLCILASALICTLYWRLNVLPRPQTPFSSADNPIAKSGSIWTRFLTFLYLPVFNFQLLLNPQVLSFDWGMDAIPRVNGLFDSRNWLSIGFYGSLTLICYSCYGVFVPKDVKAKSHRASCSELTADAAYQLQHRTHRKSRAKKKFSNQQQQQQQQHLHTSSNYGCDLVAANTNHNSSSSNINNNNNSQTVPYFVSCICRHCKHDLASGTTQQAHNNINNNNNNNINNNNNNINCNNNNFNNNNYITDCCCHQLLTAGNVSQPSTLFTLHKSNALITSRSSRSSSSCSNSTTASQKSNTSSCSSISSTSSTGYGLYCHATTSQHLLLRCMPQHTRSAYVILMALSFLVLPFLPATNIFFYVGFVVAERLLYLPSVGYCLLVGVGIAKLREFLGDSEHVRKRKIALAFCCSVVLSLLSARTVYRNSDWRDDESLYRSAIEVNPPKALGNLGSVMSSQGRYEEAKEALLLALKYRPNMADAHYNLGILYQNQEFYKDAVESFRRAIQYRPNLAIAYVNLGSSLISLGKCQEAANILQKGAKLEGVGVRDRSTHDNARISAYLQLGALYAGQAKLQRALAIYREALDTLPHIFYQRDILYNRIGDIFGRQQQWTEAEKYHRAALQLQPNQVAAHLSYGITLSRNHSRASEAEMWFKRALKLAPQDSSVFHHYAEFLSSQSRAEEALIYRLTAAELTPNDYSLVVAAATALRLLDRKTEAETWYRKAVELRPKDAHAHTNLGAILHLIGRTNSAAASYKEALRLQPGDPTTLENLTKLGIHAGEIK